MDNWVMVKGKSKSKSKSKKTLFKVGPCKQYNISSHLKWVADKSKLHRKGYATEHSEHQQRYLLYLVEWQSYLVSDCCARQDRS